ncbi:hypothetical protein GLOIN_2v1775768 [Rhizophagus irregularis DAOM 181602=DAOM 197198]|uniref:Uncharacterized protein n=1 Tax=Rhizophagus irregularis (strain DAOM 181602 / DAOM 197198 / MUCL 43194) TaxID=747089 RepID=A0A2P4PYL1_RHIID|nr:hypothetical protein GLOIN_2v1775768 [Rhizophagus irregularis DAOM 181602=DAOM 197198]POG70481.1 hypothetical protein GLOIN_2v1775768 [Rhizophagus irregularis DAOM 181602=DAOM 197198]CAG8438501.1 2079_t:CDS:2 [Rhizophagus irregularis]|eukprot:XP_025177347.1 hypothetical protein GLOIN_2v1775768 [Rhizophagus irregularis DAOM 181602=DAOM 197198]
MNLISTCLAIERHLNDQTIDDAETAEIDYLDEDVAYIFDLIRFAGEAVSRASRARRDKACEGDEGIHLDWLFNHELGAKESWNHEFSLCERAGSVIDNTMKIFSNTLKLLMPGLYVSTDLAELEIPTDYVNLIKFQRLYI